MKKTLKIKTYCSIYNNTIEVNGTRIHQEDAAMPFVDFAKKIYKTHNIAYPKFFKMDKLSKLAFLSAEILSETLKENQNIAIVLSNKAASLDTDRKYQNSISDKANYYPSPAVFVYTLPNIAIGEISIRHQLKSENAFFVFEKFNADFLTKYATSLMEQQKASQVLCGWVDYDEDHYKAFLYLVNTSGTIPHTSEQIDTLFG